MESKRLSGLMRVVSTALTAELIFNAVLLLGIVLAFVGYAVYLAW